MKPLMLASAIAILLGASETRAQNYAAPALALALPSAAPGYNPERPARSGWRRGQYLPPAYRTEVVTDYARYHLRRPPPGYAWYRDADDYILASVNAGLIFEVISGD